MYSLGQDSSAEKLQKMMSAVDKDGDKKVDWEEFEGKLGDKVGTESANALQYARKAILSSTCRCAGARLTNTPLVAERRSKSSTRMGTA